MPSLFIGKEQLQKYKIKCAEKGIKIKDQTRELIGKFVEAEE